MLRTKHFVVALAIVLVSCGSGNSSDATAIATAEVGNADGAAATATVASDASVAATTPAPAALDPTKPDGVSQAFFDAYKSDPSGDASAAYFTQGMTDLYNSGKTVATITGIDPSYTSATVVNTQLYNDNKNAIVTVELVYATGSQKVDVTLEQQNDQWRVAAIAAQPQK